MNGHSTVLRHWLRQPVKKLEQITPKRSTLQYDQMNSHVMGFHQLVQKFGHSKKTSNTKHFYSSRDTK